MMMLVVVRVPWHTVRFLDDDDVVVLAAKMTWREIFGPIEVGVYGLFVDWKLFVFLSTIHCQITVPTLFVCNSDSWHCLS
jgi:hypothetical protein